VSLRPSVRPSVRPFVSEMEFDTRHMASPKKSIQHHPVCEISNVTSTDDIVELLRTAGGRSGGANVGGSRR